MNRNRTSTMYRATFLLVACLAAGGAAAQPPPEPPPFALLQNDPDPFCPGTEPTAIRFAIQVPCDVTLTVRDGSNAVVRLLLHGALQPGFYEIQWDGRDDHGALVPDGAYPYELLAEVGDVPVFVASRTAEAACIVALEPATWGRIKALYGRGD